MLSYRYISVYPQKLYESWPAGIPRSQQNTGRRPETLAVVSSEYHLYRAGLMARQMGVQALGVPANTYPVIDRIYYTYREILALWGYWIFGMTN